MAGSYSFLTSYLLGQSPMLLLYLIAIVLALILWQRSSTAAVLVLAGSALAIVLAVAWALAMNWAIKSGNTRQMQAWGLLSSVLHAISHGLIIAAAFVGRGAPQGTGFEVRPASSYPPGPPPLRR